MDNLSRESLCKQLALKCPDWDKDRWDRFIFTLTPEEQVLEVQMYIDADEHNAPSMLAEALKVINSVMSVVGYISGLSSAANGIKNLVG